MSVEFRLNKGDYISYYGCSPGKFGVNQAAPWGVLKVLNHIFLISHCILIIESLYTFSYPDKGDIIEPIAIKRSFFETWTGSSNRSYLNLIEKNLMPSSSFY